MIIKYAFLPGHSFIWSSIIIDLSEQNNTYTAIKNATYYIENLPKTLNNSLERAPDLMNCGLNR